MNEQEIFEQALEQDPEKRAAFLEAACAGDATLRRRLEALLRAHTAAPQFLEVPAVEQLAARNQESGKAGDDLTFLSPSSEPRSLGRLDHYEVLEVIGHGGTGVVLRACDAKLQRVVALKVLAAPLAASGTARQRFAREARAAAAVRDDHVVAIYAVCDDAPMPYLVMELINGCNLEALIRRGGPLDVKEVLRIGIQVASGLAAAHKQGLIHRDVKPANILLENGVQRVKLTDFGLARAADDANLTQSGFIAGTPLYMAPEQAASEALDPRADLFSLGSVLYEACTGRPAFRAPTTAGVIRRVCDETPRPIREVNPDVPEPLCRLIERLHAKQPADRPASAQEVADVLAQLLADLQGQRQGSRALSSPVAAPLRAPLRILSAPPRLLAAAAVVLLVAGLGLSEATGVTDVRGTVIRLFSPDGTLVVEVDDPGVSVAVDGADVVITGAGVRELRLRPGQYKLEARKDGEVVRREVVTVHHNGRQVVRISKEAEPLATADEWVKSVAALPATQQVEPVVKRLKALNPGFDGQVTHTCFGPAVVSLHFSANAVKDLSPLRALKQLEALSCYGTPGEGKLADLSPLRGLSLKSLNFGDNRVSDLSPVKGMPLAQLWCYRNEGLDDLTPLTGMPLTWLECGATRIANLSPLWGMKLTHLSCNETLVSDLSPLRGMPLKDLDASFSRVSGLSPLEGMPLRKLWVMSAPVSDLSPLRGMPLKELQIQGSAVTDLSPLTGMPLTVIALDFQAERDATILRSLTSLETINGKPAAEFWKDLDGK